ncbi:MAG: hypothetical protein VKL41_11925 [Snowella sp.]|nr:hypothetical protein [Snowella sp.]
MKNYLNLLKILKNNTHSGYTLVELILASVVTLLVVSAAGYGVYVMTRENMVATASGDIKYNLGRALDFISEEVKTASSVATGLTVTSLPSGCGTGTPTLVLTIPFTATSGSQLGQSSPYNVYYFTKAPDSTWLGTNAIYRCGPFLDSDGNVVVDGTTGVPPYSTLADTNPSHNKPPSQMLVDLIASGRDSNDSGTCVNGGTPWPNDGGSPPKGNTGFFVCISGNNKMVEIHAASSALESRTDKNSLNFVTTGGRLAQDATYGLITQAYSRAN